MTNVVFRGDCWFCMYDFFVVTLFLMGIESAINCTDLSAGFENNSGIFLHNFTTSSNFLAICCDIVSGVSVIL